MNNIKKHSSLYDNLPKYYIAGIRPVKMLGTEDGGLAIYALSWETGEFVLDMWFLAEIGKYNNDDIEEVSEEEFNKKVEELRRKIKEKKL